MSQRKPGQPTPANLTKPAVKIARKGGFPYHKTATAKPKVTRKSC